MPQVLLNGINTYYRLDGARPRVFLLFNGAGNTTRTWGEMADGLAGMGQVIRFDMRGTGQTDSPRDPYTLDTLATDALALLDYLEIQRAIIIGHAFGGRVSQIFARDYQHRVLALIICGTGGYFPPLPGRQDAANLFNPNVSRSVWEDAFLDRFCGSEFRRQQPERAQRLLDEVWAERSNPANARLRRQAVQATPSPTYWGTTLPSLPVLLLYGTEDRMGTAENAHDLANRLKNAQLVFIEGAGHMAIREKPERLLEEIARFINELGL